MVSFRLLEEEYDRLLDASKKRGANSVSDFARISLCGLIGADGAEGGIETEARKLSGSVRQLNQELQRLSQLIEKSLRQNNGNGA